MAEKEEFIVGPGACRLSGGQQQRTAIARAIYCDSDLYLIDDCFSSVDP
jgi:ABC-type multidrug transport system fused ATPase/permease subunit